MTTIKLQKRITLSKAPNLPKIKRLSITGHLINIKPLTPLFFIPEKTLEVLMKKILSFYLLSALLAGVFGQQAPEDPSNLQTTSGDSKSLPAMIGDYENSSLSWISSSDDDGFLNIFLSLQFPIIPALFSIEPVDFAFLPYLAFNTRLGFYLNTRYSSPVIGKRFNPKFILLRLYPLGYNTETRTSKTYIDFSYAHESNGQIIDKFSEFNTLSSRIGEQAAKDYIDRGWDYIELKTEFHTRLKENIFATVMAQFNFFLNDSLFQGPPGEYYAWENDPEPKTRDEVHGIKLGITFLFESRENFIRGSEFGIYYTTGIRNSFKYNSFKLELAMVVFHIPFYLSYNYGYLNDLALYYKHGSQAEAGVRFDTW